MKHGIHNSTKPKKSGGKSSRLNRQSLIQTLGGITALSAIPLTVAFCFSPGTHAWVQSFTSRYSKAVEAVERDNSTQRFLLPNSVLKIAKISTVKPERVSIGATEVSVTSRAIIHLQQTLQDHAGSKAEDVLRAANENQPGTDRLACPFESINGEQSLVLGRNARGQISLAKVLDRCAEAIEQLGTPRSRSGYR